MSLFKNWSTSRVAPAYRTYAEQLVRLGHGLPLWIPEKRQFGEIDIGDVGYFSEGAFIRFFNITKAADSTANCFGVPEGFIPLAQDGVRVDRTPGFVPPGPIFIAQSMEREVSAEASVASSVGGTSTIDMKYALTCHSDRGAVAVFGEKGERARILSGNWTFPRYMLKHHASWQEFAYSKFQVDLHAEDIVLISGWVKTPKWDIAAIDKHMREEDIRASAKMATLSARLSLSSKDGSAMSVSHRSSLHVGEPGSEGTLEATSETGCLFLRYYKLKKRSFLPSHLSYTVDHKSSTRDMDPQPRRRRYPNSDNCGSGGVSGSGDTSHSVANNPGKTSEFVGGSTLRPQTETTFNCLLQSDNYTVEEPMIANDEFVDPLTHILDYILDHSLAEVAIAHHDDLYDIMDNPYNWPHDSLSHAIKKLIPMRCSGVCLDENIRAYCLDTSNGPMLLNLDEQKTHPATNRIGFLTAGNPILDKTLQSNPAIIPAIRLGDGGYPSGFVRTSIDQTDMNYFARLSSR